MGELIFTLINETKQFWQSQNCLIKLLNSVLWQGQ